MKVRQEILMPTRICLHAALLLFLMQLYIHLILSLFQAMTTPDLTT